MRGDRFIDIDAIADEVEARLCQRMVAQRGSPLGARTHRAAVIRRLEQQQGGAAIHQRKFLLSRSALQEELDRESEKALSQRKRSTPDSGALHRKAGERRQPRKARDQSPELDALQREIVGGLRELREVR